MTNLWLLWFTFNYKHQYLHCMSTSLLQARAGLSYSINTTYRDSVVFVHPSNATPSTNVAIRIRVVSTQHVDNSLRIHIKVVIEMTVPPAGIV